MKARLVKVEPPRTVRYMIELDIDEAQLDRLISWMGGNSNRTDDERELGMQLYKLRYG